MKKKAIITLFFILSGIIILNNPVKADTIEHYPHYLGPTQGVDDYEIIDLDEDSDKDVVYSASGGSGGWGWFRNDGGGSFTHIWTYIIGSSEDHKRVDVADLDDDVAHDLDVVVSDFADGYIYWYENDGSENFTKRTAKTGLTGAMGVKIIDYDADGDKDILATAETNDDVVLLKNDGSEVFSTTYVDSSNDGAEVVDFADFDGDTDYDVIAGGMETNGTTSHYLYTAPSTFAETIDYDYQIYDLVATQLDDDADYDYVTIGTGNTIYWYDNNGSATFTRKTVTADYNSGYMIQAADVDGDGDKDLPVASWNHGASWFRNDGSENFVEVPVNVGSYSYSIAVGDIDGDSDMDLVGRHAGTGNTYWYENQADVTAPTYGTVSPVDGSTSATPTTNLVINFNEIVTAQADKYIYIKRTSDDALFETIPAVDARVTGSGTGHITINPTGALSELIDYYVLIDAGAFLDEVSLSYAGIADKTTWNFTTTDVTPPTLSSFNPVDNATYVPITNNFVITLNETIARGTSGTIYLKKTSDDSTVESFAAASSPRLSLAGAAMTIDPTSNLLESTGYYITICSGCIKDAYNNSYAGFTDKTVWNITSGDASTPLVSALSPLDDAPDVVVDTNLAITFNENVNTATGNVYIKKSYNDSIVETIDITDAGKVSGSGTATITINPTANLGALLGYYIQIDSGAIEDLTGNDYGGIADTTTWNFTTAGTAGFTVSTISTDTTETGGEATFNVHLNTEPIDTVTIPVSSSDITEGTVSTPILTFESSNWSIDQTVTVTGVDDDIVDGNIAYSAVLGTTSSLDSNYNSLDPDNVSVTNIDDDTAGVTVSAISADTTEVGGTATYTIVLDSEPAGAVEIDVSSYDITEGIVTSASTFTFNAGNWDTPQEVTVTGQNDDIDDNNQVYNIENIIDGANTEDPLYDLIDPDDTAVTNTDDDTAGYVVIPLAGDTTEAGASQSFSIRLSSEPTHDVIFPVASADITEGSINPLSVTINSSNWDEDHVVTVTGVDDDVDDGDIGYTVEINTSESDDPNYDGADLDNFTLNNIDDDTAGITVGSISGHTTEAGGTATFTVVLDTQPTGNVEIEAASNDGSEGIVGGSALTFTTGNWNIPQAIIVNGQNDYFVDGNISYSILNTVDTINTADAMYDAIDPADVSVINDDNDTASITVSAISGNTTETGGTATFTVRLNSEPTHNVTIPVSSSDTSEGTASTSLLTFTSGNWDLNQTVTITGINDDVDDGNIVYTAILGTISSSDSNYNSINPLDVSITNTDDDTAGFAVSALSNDTDESGNTGTFTVHLNSEPTANVVIPVSSTNNNEVSVAISSLTFTSANWNSNQEISVTGVDDNIDDGNQNTTIELQSATSLDANYNALNPSDVTVINTDNDTAGFTISNISGQTTEEGDVDIFTVRLNSEPTHNVTIPVSSSDTSEGTASTSLLTFTSGNWDLNQTVTITGINDDVDDNDIAYTVELGTTDSVDINYDNQNLSDFTLSNVDNDTAGITVDESSLSVTENGATDSFNVVLNTKPITDVAVTLADTNNEITIDPGILTFTSSNWNTPQAVTVSAVDDTDVEASQSDTISQTVVSSDEKYNSYALDNIAVIITDNDETPNPEPEPEPEPEDQDENNNGIPDEYESIEPTDENAVNNAIINIVGANQGAIEVTYADDTTATLIVFDNDTSKKETIIKQISNTAYYLVAQAFGKKVAVINILNGDILSTKSISKKKWQKGIGLQLVTLRKKKWVLITEKNSKNKVQVTVLKFKTNYTLGKKSQIKFKSAKVNTDKTTVAKNKILIKSNKNKIIKKISLTGKGKLIF